MAYDEGLATRVRGGARRSARTGREADVRRAAFLVSGNMACGVQGDDLIVRVAADDAETALDEPGTRPFDLTGRR